MIQEPPPLHVWAMIGKVLTIIIGGSALAWGAFLWWARHNDDID